MQKHYNDTRPVQLERHFEVAKRRIGGSHDVHVFTQFTERLFATATSTTCTFYNVYLSIEYATSAGHYKKCIHTEMRKKDIKHFGKKHLFWRTAIQSVEAVEWPLQVVTSIVFFKFVRVVMQFQLRCCIAQLHCNTSAIVIGD